MQILAPYKDHIYAVTRILAGFMFAGHGAQKVLGMFGGTPPDAPAFVIWVAGPIELVGGLLIATGLFTGPAAFVSSGLMACAYFMAHQPQGLLPIQNHGELAVLYCWLFLFIAAKGSGPLSVDAARGAP